MASISRKDGVILIAPNEISMYTLNAYLPYIETFYEELHLYLPKSLKNIFSNRDYVVKDYAKLRNKSKYLRKLIYFGIILSNGRDYSLAYRTRYLSKIEIYGPWAVKVLSLAQKCYKYLNITIVSNLLTDLINLCAMHRFKFHNIIVISRCDIEPLLLNRNYRITTILESWDHIYKCRFGYHSKIIVAWCAKQAADALNYQNCDNSIVSYPVKIGYAIPSKSKLSGRIPVKNQIIYPMTYSLYSGDKEYREEIKFLKKLVKWSMFYKINLIIKLKPNSKSEELELFRFMFDGIKIFSGETGAYCSSGYYFSEEYNLKRKRLIESSSYIINIGTTFCLDASAGNCSVIQMDLRDNSDYPAIATNQNYEHLKLFLEDPDLTYTTKTFFTDDLFKRLAKNEELEAPKHLANKVRDYLQINQPRYESEELQRVVKEIHQIS